MVFSSFQFSKFSGGACPETPLETRAFGARPDLQWSIGWTLSSWWNDGYLTLNAFWTFLGKQKCQGMFLVLAW